MAQIKSVTIKELELKEAGYEVEVEKDERGTFYFIYRKGRRVVEVLKRKEDLKKGKVIIMGNNILHYCEAVKITADDNSLKLEGHNLSVMVFI